MTLAYLLVVPPWVYLAANLVAVVLGGILLWMVLRKP